MSKQPSARRNFLRGLLAGLFGWTALPAVKAATPAAPFPAPVPVALASDYESFSNTIVYTYDGDGRLTQVAYVRTK